MDQHGGNIHYYLNNKIKFIDFSASINPLGFPEYVHGLVNKTIKNIIHYPEPDSFSFCEKIAKYHNIHPDHVMAGNGTCELIHLLLKVFKPKTVLIPSPSFSEYEKASKISGSKIIFDSNFNSVKKSDMIFFNNPNNPTGKVFDKDFILNLLNNNKLLVLDEAFIDFLPDHHKYSLINESVHSDQIIVLRSLTKFFALPGLRLGYLTASIKNIRKIKENHYPWSVNYLAGKIGEKILFDENFRKNTHSYIQKEKKHFFEGLSKIKQLECFESQVNYFLLKTLKKDVNTLQKFLLNKNILIRNCLNFRNLDNTYFRVAIRTREENKVLIQSLKGFYES